MGGYPAKRIEITIPAGLDTSTCSIPGLQIWADPAETDFFALADLGEGGGGSVYVVDVDGERAVIVTAYSPEASAADIAELDAIVGSIRFEP